MRTGSVKQSDATEQRNSRVPCPRSRGSLRPASDVGGLGGPSGRDRTARAGAQRGRGVEGADERSRVIIAPTPKRAPGDFAGPFPLVPAPVAMAAKLTIVTMAIAAAAEDGSDSRESMAT